MLIYITVRFRPVSFALLDIMMPEMDDYKVIREIRKMSFIPIIIILHDLKITVQFIVAYPEK